MKTLILRKWWVLLIQGILAIILAFIVFNNPIETLAVLSVWLGSLVVIAGIIGLLSRFWGDNDEQISFWWSILTIILGLVMLFNLVATMKLISIVVGIWVILTGLFLFQAGNDIRKVNPMGWVILLGGVICILMALAMIFNFTKGAIGVSILMGLQLLFSGILLIIFSFAKRALVNRLSDKISSLREGSNT
jgi:uncharacterized membrane protein HdeD (DUF308 family)